MPTDPARRIVEEVLKEAASIPLIGEHYRRRDDLYIPAAPKLAQMLKVALDGLDEAWAVFEHPGFAEVRDKINRIAEED